MVAGVRLRSAVAAVATAGAWLLAVHSWVVLYRQTDGGNKLGFDLLATWRAEKVFAHGGPPYSVKAFLYPPSSLLLFRPLAPLSHHQLTLFGLIGTLVAGWLVVMLAAVAVGRRWWGLTAAVTIWLLSYAQAMRGDLSLENVSVLGALLLVLFYLLALRGHWLAAGAAIGVSLAIKPLLLVVLLVFLAARQWKALAVAVAVPAVLNGIAFLLVSDPGQVWSKLPSLLNRSGYGINFNSAWVDVARTLGLPLGVTWLLRALTVAVVVWAAVLAWSRIADARLRLITTCSVLLIGSFLAGTLSEYHFMLTLVPLGMTIVLAKSIMRTVASVLGMCWIMGIFVLPAAWLGVNKTANFSAYRAFGMSLVLIAAVVVILRQRPHDAETPPNESLDVREPQPEVTSAVSA